MIDPSTRHIVFDIDGVLCCNRTTSIEEACFYLRHGAIITAMKTHYVFPGVIELFQLLFSTENVRISFFSSGIEERNTLFVKELLTYALGEEHYARIADSVIILSKQHLEDINQHRKKNLKLFNKPGFDLSNTILIDDDRLYSYPEQEQNLLAIPETDNIDMKSRLYEVESYNDDGYKKIPSVNYFELEVGASLCQIEKDDIQRGRCLALIRQNDLFSIAFANRENNQFVRYELNNTEHENIIENLTRVVNEDPEGIEENEELMEKIYQLIDDLEGRSVKINKNANRIAYLTGLLFQIMESATEHESTLAFELFNGRQYLKTEEERTYIMNDTLIHDMRIYEYGLRKLQEINPNLSFCSPKLYKNCTELPSTDEETYFLTRIRDNQTNGCLIM